ncbi:MAG: restriction endonuclease subunit S [Campylobacterales bacterium]|nr:restriction endonuclease subunit S [Campylobacterales bacterium]
MKTKKLSFKADELPKQIIDKYTLPCLTSSFQNQGLNYFVPKDGTTILKNVISIPSNSDIYRAYFQSNEFTVLSDAYAIRWVLNNVKLSPNQYLFAVQCINKITDLSIYSYKNKLGGWNVVKNKYIQLPIKNGKIDFDFMEKFIAELEAERIAELEDYLSVSGLKDYTLTAEEQQVLNDFENGKIKFGEFKVGELFEINSYQKRFDANKVVISEVGKPYIVRTSLNNGVRGYINEDEQFLNEGNTISFGQDTATMFYQEKPYFTGDKIKIVKSKDNELNKLNAQFFISTMTKSFSSFSWGGSSFSVKIIEN